MWLFEIWFFCRKVARTKKLEIVKFSDFSQKLNLLSSKVTRCISSNNVPIDVLLLVKSYLVAEHYYDFLAKETCWAKIAKNWILVWFPLIMKLAFPWSTCRDIFSPTSQSKRSNTRCFIFSTYSLHLSLDHLIALSCQQLCLWMIILFGPSFLAKEPAWFLHQYGCRWVLFVISFNLKQSTLSINTFGFYNINQYPNSLFSSFLRKFVKPKLPEVLYPYDASSYQN